MPGTLTGPVTGFVYREKGKSFIEAGALARMGKSSASFTAGGQLSVQLSVAGIGNGADTTEDTLFTANLPANALDVFGRCIALLAWGSVTATSATKTAKVYFGTSITTGTSLQWTTTQTGFWQVYMMVWKQAANVQLGLTEYDAAGATSTRSLLVNNAGSETDTAAITCKVTGQSSVATANTVICNGFQICGYN